MDYTSRRHKLQEQLRKSKLDALLITHLPNVRYLCGFTGSSGWLIVSGERATFITDGRYSEQARAEVKGARIIIAKSLLQTAVKELGIKGAIGIEADHMTVASEAAFRELLPKSKKLRPIRGMVEGLRRIKDSDEANLIRIAVLTGSALLDTALEAVRPGVPEADVAAELEYAARRAGAEGMSFETIVASGARSALPHGRASGAEIAAKGFVVLDFGVILAGYCSDMTRTVYVGRPDSGARRLYQSVLDAQLAGIDAVRPGIGVEQVDRAARAVLTKAGFGKYFTHSTGHGVGLEIHESPRVGRGVTDVLEPGMVITIEPGAYVRGFGGVRIEDMVLVTGGGCEVLTPSPKELIAL
jgi:Xaa-Pro aminopeptidase